MKYVTIPFAGYCTVAIDEPGDLDDEALIAKAMEIAGAAVRIDSQDPVEIEEWELLRHLVRGNVCYAPAYEADVEDAS